LRCCGCCTALLPLLHRRGDWQVTVVLPLSAAAAPPMPLPSSAATVSVTKLENIIMMMGRRR
jgi:hypothetical protein